MRLPFGSYKLPFAAASARRLVNAYAEVAPPEQPNGEPVYLCRPQGIRQLADTTETEGRGGCMMGDVAYLCFGDKLYSYTQGGTLTALTGDAITGNGQARVLTNGSQIVVVPGDGTAYSSDGSTVTEITDATFEGWGALDAAYVEGYFVFVRPDTADIFNPDVDSLTFNGLKITSINAIPGNLLGIAACRGELVLTKTASSERWYDAGLTPGSPFSRSPGGEWSIGTAAGKSLVVQEDMAFMLAADKTVRRLGGGSWEQISHPGIDAIMKEIENPEDCYSLAWSEGGHHFVALTFRNGGRTIVHDLTTGEWHERESRVGTVSLGYWRPAFILQAWGMQLVGDSQSGKIGVLDPEVFEEFGEPQVMSWAYPNVYGPGQGVSHRELSLFVASGKGPITGQGSEPLLTLRVSDDGGNTWRTREFGRLGKIGQFERRTRFFNLGPSTNRVYECVISDPLPVMAVRTDLVADGAHL